MKTLIYPKTYGTIIHIEQRPSISIYISYEDWLLVKTDDEQLVWLPLRNKSGSKSSVRVVKGARVKVFDRGGWPHFRLMGD